VRFVILGQNLLQMGSKWLLEKVKDFSFILKKTEEMSRYMRAQGKQEATPRINASPSHNNDWANPGMDKRTMVKSFDLMLMTF